MKKIKLLQNEILDVTSNNIDDVIKMYDRTQYIKFFCINCNKETIIQIRKRLNGKLLCADCLRRYNQKLKYGSVDEAYKLREEKRKKTCLEKYGTEYANQNKDVKEKIRQTFLSKTDEEKKEIYDRIKNTNIQRYGVPSILADKDKIQNALIDKYGSVKEAYKERQDKIKQTNLERYGVEYNLQRKEIIEKSKETKLKKYGKLNNLDKTHETCKIKYGNPNYNNRSKATQTYMEKYGYCHPMKNPEISKKVGLKYSEFNFNKIAKLYCDEYDFFTENNKHFFKCKKCGNVYEYTLLKRLICRNCYPKLNGTSNGEKEIVKYLESLGFEVKKNTKMILNCTQNPTLQNIFKKYGFKENAVYELDIYLPKLKIAIEYDGLYWHSTKNNINKYYHLAKTEMCEALGIRLIHIFENQWLEKRLIVEDLLNFNKQRIYARKCELRLVDGNTTNNFLTNYHIQGARPASVRLGLYYNNELVQIMTFGKSRYNKKYEWELIRECSKSNLIIVGGCSKLLKFFEKTYKPKSLISYCDRKLFLGKSYINMGFTLCGLSPVSYAYIGPDHKVYNREVFQKHKIASYGLKFDKDLTEVQNMNNNNFYQIFDCGEFIFEKIY